MNWVRFLLPVLVIQISFCLALAAKDEAVVKFLATIAEQRKPVDPKTLIPTAPIRIHFFWATWCPYCVESYTSLKEIQRSQASGKIQILAYCMDERIDDKVREKMAAMKDAIHFHVPKKQEDFPSELARFPLSIGENTQNHKIAVYTGFSNERMRLLKKFITRSLSSQGVEDEE